MNKLFTDNAWQDYLYWQKEDRKTLKRINQLIQDISRNGNTGIGKPEPLVGPLAGHFDIFEFLYLILLNLYLFS